MVDALRTLQQAKGLEVENMGTVAKNMVRHIEKNLREAQKVTGLLIKDMVEYDDEE